MRNSTNIICIVMIVFVLSGSILVIHFQAFAVGCYDKFIFNWFTLNDVLICLDSGTSVITLTSSNNAIILNSTSGNILITPRLELLCQNRLTINATSISCSEFEEKNYLLVSAKLLSDATGGTTLVTAMQFNSDTGNNYSWRKSNNGGADTTATSDNNCLFGGLASGGGVFITMEISNEATLDNKLLIVKQAGDFAGSATTAPSKLEMSCKWNDSNAITTISFVKDSGTRNFDTDSEITVWGYD